MYVPYITLMSSPTNPIKNSSRYLKNFTLLLYGESSFLPTKSVLRHRLQIGIFGLKNSHSLLLNVVFAWLRVHYRTVTGVSYNNLAETAMYTFLFNVAVPKDAICSVFEKGFMSSSSKEFCKSAC
jgi:hypothetical protein